jgi:F0F1-type ATP synthase epsilon subunit
MKHAAAKTPLNVIARAPFRIYYEGVAKSLSASNAVGSFDVLPGHASFFSVLTPGEIVIETEEKPVIFNVANGIISVQADKVLLFVNM